MPVWAYPRSHGATSYKDALTNDLKGLSPLARGNRCPIITHDFIDGPIPARTGQPLAMPRSARATWAYPRSHGATQAARFSRALPRGLSPLARGNPNCRRARAQPPGPIPARTGQPRPDADLRRSTRAYPRSHGATPMLGGMKKPPRGLSPLARGNPCQCWRYGAPGGPIPARTGQPPRHAPRLSALRAYPRSHGATKAIGANAANVVGLSPLARGNRAAAIAAAISLGPIPARTGQPRFYSAR